MVVWSSTKDSDYLKSGLRIELESIDEMHDFAKETLIMLRDGPMKIKQVESKVYNQYLIFVWKTEPRDILSRPVNSNLFIRNKEELERRHTEIRKTISNHKDIPHKLQENIKPSEINSVFYTLAIFLGLAGDFVLSSNSARKNVGERFGDLVIGLLDFLNVTSTDKIQPYGKSKIDCIIGP